MSKNYLNAKPYVEHTLRKKCNAMELKNGINTCLLEVREVVFEVNIRNE